MTRTKIIEILNRNNYRVAVTLLKDGCSINFPGLPIQVFTFTPNGLKLAVEDLGLSKTIECGKCVQRLLILQYIYATCNQIGYDHDFVAYYINDAEVEFDEFFGYCAPQDMSEEDLDKEAEITTIIEQANPDDIVAISKEYNLTESINAISSTNQQ